MIKSLDELTAFLKICRKQGVTNITCEGLVVSFGDLPVKQRMNDSDEIPTDELTPEQLAYYSVGGAD